MLDLDSFPSLYAQNKFDGPRNQDDFKNIIRQNNKILIEATDQSIKYTTERNRIGSTFESLLRSLGLGAGVILGGPVGAATISAISGGIGRGVGDYLGNRVYGKTLGKLNQVVSEQRYQQLINFYTLDQLKTQGKLVDEFYSQAQQDVNQTATELASGQ